MRKLIIAAGLVGLTAGMATAAEFQPIGTLGMGGAGVARSMGPYASYWNPAGLAFADKAFAMTVGGGVGMRVSDGLANNVDRLSKFTENDPNTGKSAFDNLKDLSTTAASADALGNVVSLLNVFKDIETQKGTISLNVDGAAGFQIKHVGFGLYGLGEGFAQPLPDTINVLPKLTGITTASTPANVASALADAVVGASGTVTVPYIIKNPEIVAPITAALSKYNLTAAQLGDFIASIDKGISPAAGANSNLPTMTSSQAVNTVTNTLVPAIDKVATGQTIDNNQTAVMVKNVLFFEVPVAYGYAFDFGNMGKLGVGGALKAVRARVYQTRIRLNEPDPNDPTKTVSVKSSDITNALKDNYTESTSVTFDLGTQYKYSDWLTVGLVAKNLTSPKFKSPELRDHKNRLVDKAGNIVTTPFRDEDVTLKPQVRLGASFDPWWWLTIATDLDLTANETVLSGLDYKSRHFGGGLEMHALSWFKMRAGIYKNLADSEIGPVATAGLTFGIPWVLLEVDGAYGLDKARYKDKDYPKEARVQAQLTVQF